MGFQPLQQLHLFQVFLIGFGRFLRFVDPAVQHVQIRENQFQVDGLNIPGRADFAVYVDDLGAFETADHMDDGVHFPDVGQKLVAEPLAFGGAFHQTCNIHKLDDGRGVFVRIVHFGQHVQPPVRHCHNPHIGFNGAERIVGRLGAGVGDGVEKGAFSHVGQAHDT